MKTASQINKLKIFSLLVLTIGFYFAIYRIIYNSGLEIVYVRTAKVNITNEKPVRIETNVIVDTEEARRVIKFYKSLADSEKRYFSQNYEDGVILEILKKIKDVPGINKKYVEFGTETGVQCNTRHLMENEGWTGLLLDGSNENPGINLHKERIMHQNILDIFAKYNISNESMDLLSEDTDYADFWIIEKILTKYRPKVIVHEVNQQPPHLCVTVPKPKELVFWDSSEYHGASVCAFQCLAKAFQYTMVYCESAGVNCFWIRDDILTDYLHFHLPTMQAVLSPSFLYKKPAFVYQPTSMPWHYITC